MTEENFQPANIANFRLNSFCKGRILTRNMALDFLLALFSQNDRQTNYDIHHGNFEIDIVVVNSDDDDVNNDDKNNRKQLIRIKNSVFPHPY